MLLVLSLARWILSYVHGLMLWCLHLFVGDQLVMWATQSSGLHSISWSDDTAIERYIQWLVVRREIADSSCLISAVVWSAIECSDVATGTFIVLICTRWDCSWRLQKHMVHLTVKSCADRVTLEHFVRLASCLVWAKGRACTDDLLWLLAGSCTCHSLCSDCNCLWLLLTWISLRVMPSLLRCAIVLVGIMRALVVAISALVRWESILPACGSMSAACMLGATFFTITSDHSWRAEIAAR